ESRQSATHPQHDEGVELVEGADDLEVRGNEVRGSPRHGRSGEPRQEMHEVVDGIDPGEPQETACVIGQAGGVTNDENSKKAGGIQPGELSEHGTPVAWTAVGGIPKGVDIIERWKSGT